MQRAKIGWITRFNKLLPFVCKFVSKLNSGVSREMDLDGFFHATLEDVVHALFFTSRSTALRSQLVRVKDETDDLKNANNLLPSVQTWNQE